MRLAAGVCAALDEDTLAALRGAGIFSGELLMAAKRAYACLSKLPDSPFLLPLFSLFLSSLLFSCVMSLSAPLLALLLAPAPHSHAGSRSVSPQD